MKKVKAWFYLRLTEWRYRLFLKEIGIIISFEKSPLPTIRNLKPDKIIQKLGLSYTVSNIKSTIVADFIYYSPNTQSTLEVEYFSKVFEEFRDQINCLISFSGCKTEKHFAQFAAALNILQTTDCQTKLTINY